MQYFIRAQAQIAFSKVSRVSGLELEDLLSVGNQILDKARNTWRPDTPAQFNTYLTVLLKRDFFKIVRNSYAKTWYRVDKTLDSGEVIKEKIFVKPVSIDSSFFGSDNKERPSWELPTNTTIDPDYQILVDQVAKQLTCECRLVYKQMVDPDPELLQIAADKADPTKSTSKRNISKCILSPEMIADYLGMDMNTFSECQAKIKTIAKKLLM